MVAYAIRFLDKKGECGETNIDYFYLRESQKADEWVNPWIINFEDAAIFTTLKEAKSNKKRLYPKSRIVRIRIEEL